MDTASTLRSGANKQRGKGCGEYATGWLEQRNLKPRTRQGYSELITTGSRRPISGRRAQLETMAMALDPATGKPWGKPLTDKQQAVENMRVKTTHQKVVETEAMNPLWQ